MSAKVGVVLSGCGVFDGTEITEAVSVLIAIDKLGAQSICVAPDIVQVQVVDHLAGLPTRDVRNVLSESARIARGRIRRLSDVSADEFDAVVFPGGFGAAKNLSDFATRGADCQVNPQVTRLVQQMHAAKKPIGFACIAPVLAARVLGAKVTIGNDPATADAITKMGGAHQNAGPTDIVIDEANRVVTTPCYMYGDSTPWTIYQGAEKMVEAVLKLAKR